MKNNKISIGVIFGQLAWSMILFSTFIFMLIITCKSFLILEGLFNLLLVCGSAWLFFTNMITLGYYIETYLKENFGRKDNNII